MPDPNLSAAIKEGARAGRSSALRSKVRPRSGMQGLYVEPQYEVTRHA